MSKEFYRGEIFYIRNESEYSGNVQGGGRPAVIISNDIGNNAAPILEVVYLTTQEKKPLPTHVKINSSKYPSTVLCEQIDTVNKDKVGDCDRLNRRSERTTHRTAKEERGCRR